MAIPDQAPNSSVEGYLQGTPPGDRPGQAEPGQPLENFLQQVIAGIAGIEETLVRPRWQAQPPNYPIPKLDTDWAAVGIVRQRMSGYAAIIHYCDNPDGDGHDELQRHEEIQYLVSFYGPHCDWYANNLTDGLNIHQNLSRLKRAGLGLVNNGDITRIPELIKNEWVDRVDKQLSFNRIIVRDYPVLNLLEAPFAIATNIGYRVSMTAKP
jgi:hypothetical protein